MSYDNVHETAKHDIVFIRIELHTNSRCMAGPERLWWTSMSPCFPDIHPFPDQLRMVKSKVINRLITHRVLQIQQHLIASSLPNVRFQVHRETEHDRHVVDAAHLYREPVSGIPVDEVEPAGTNVLLEFSMKALLKTDVLRRYAGWDNRQ